MTASHAPPKGYENEFTHSLIFEAVRIFNTRVRLKIVSAGSAATSAQTQTTQISMGPINLERSMAGLVQVDVFEYGLRRKLVRVW